MGPARTTRREHHLPHSRWRTDPSRGYRHGRLPDREHGQPRTKPARRGRGSRRMDLRTRGRRPDLRRDRRLGDRGDLSLRLVHLLDRPWRADSDTLPDAQADAHEPLSTYRQSERAGACQAQNTVARQLQRSLSSRSLLPRRDRIQGTLRSHRCRQRILRSGQIELQSRPGERLVYHPRHPTGRNGRHPIHRAVQLHLRRIQGPISQQQPLNASQRLTPRIGDRRSHQHHRARRGHTHAPTTTTSSPGPAEHYQDPPQSHRRGREWRQLAARTTTAPSAGQRPELHSWLFSWVLR